MASAFRSLFAKLLIIVPISTGSSFSMPSTARTCCNAVDSPSSILLRKTFTVAGSLEPIRPLLKPKVNSSNSKGTALIP